MGRLAAAVVLILACRWRAAADEPGAADPAEADPWRGMIDGAIDRYQLSAGTDAPSPLEPRAVLRWDNNVRGSALGLTVLYLAQGRPEAVCCIFPLDGKLYHEFGSLSRGPLRASCSGEVPWRPDEPGVEFHTLGGARPHTVAQGRGRQLRQLAARFSVTLTGWDTDSAKRQDLRLLPKPIFRYEVPPETTAEESATDGAVFAFVTGVDPEVLLMLEAVGAGDTSRWQYGLVRRTSGGLEARLDDQVVWEVAAFPASGDPLSTFRQITSPLELEDEREPAPTAGSDSP
jgi:hypothetical protein